MEDNKPRTSATSSRQRLSRTAEDLPGVLRASELRVVHKKPEHQPSAEIQGSRRKENHENSTRHKENHENSTDSRDAKLDSQGEALCSC